MDDPTSNDDETPAMIRAHRRGVRRAVALMAAGVALGLWTLLHFSIDRTYYSDVVTGALVLVALVLVGLAAVQWRACLALEATLRGRD